MITIVDMNSLIRTIYSLTPCPNQTLTANEDQGRSIYNLICNGERSKRKIFSKMHKLYEGQTDGLTDEKSEGQTSSHADIHTHGQDISI